MKTTKRTVPKKATKTAAKAPAANGRRARNGAKSRTPEEIQQFTEHIENLIKHLDSLNPREHDKALKKLTSEELFFVAAWTTYDNHQKGLRLA